MNLEDLIKRVENEDVEAQYELGKYYCEQIISICTKRICNKKWK